MNMCMPSPAAANTSLMFHLNQYMLYSNTSGPRGRSRATGPGMWMLMYDQALSPSNRLHVDVMGSPEQLTVGDKGTPQLLQTENVDNMHAHDTIMALQFRDAVTLGVDGKQQLTFLFAPRGEAAIGPVPFMHRASAEGNPDAPLGHALQDGFHDVSTVFGAAFKAGATSLEATAFSGRSIRWPLPLHGPDSYGLRVKRDIDGHLGVGVSYADARLPDDVGGAQHSRYLSAWLTTSHQILGGSLKSASVWAQVRAGHDPALNSFLEEAVFERGRNRVYGRAEALQATPEQLNIVVAGGATNPRSVAALTVGYERALLQGDVASLSVGGSYTQDLVPEPFQPAYGSDPHGLKLYLRLKVDRPLMSGGLNQVRSGR